jgi:hypothetical protein
MREPSLLPQQGKNHQLMQQGDRARPFKFSKVPGNNTPTSSAVGRTWSRCHRACLTKHKKSLYLDKEVSDGLGRNSSGKRHESLSTPWSRQQSSTFGSESRSRWPVCTIAICLSARTRLWVRLLANHIQGTVVLEHYLSWFLSVQYQCNPYLHDAMRSWLCVIFVLASWLLPDSSSAPSAVAVATIVLAS